MPHDEDCPVPERLRQAYARWDRAGRPRQPGIAWNPAPWRATLPEFGPLFDDLPNPLDRGAVRDRARQARDDRETLEAFVAAMVWGYGRVGYGAFRTARVLAENPEPGATLREAAARARDEGGPAAFGWLARNRLRWLGVAFATKFLYFAGDGNADPPPLILDRLVRDWLRDSTGCRLSLDWNVTDYRRYVRAVTRWAAELKVAPSDIEYLIFSDAVGDRPTSQWGEVPYLEEEALAPEGAGSERPTPEVAAVLDALDDVAELFSMLPASLGTADADDFEYGLRQLRRILVAGSWR